MSDSEAFRTAVRTCLAAMLDINGSPYESALEALGLASGLPVDGGDEAIYSLANIWGALTDWIELRPATSDQAEAHMVDAARQWLTVEGDREAEAQYLDHWLNLLDAERPALFHR